MPRHIYVVSSLTLLKHNLLTWRETLGIALQTFPLMLHRRVWMNGAVISTAPMRSGEMIARYTQLVTLNEEWCSRLLSNPVKVFPEQGRFGSSVPCRRWNRWCFTPWTLERQSRDIAELISIGHCVRARFRLSCYIDRTCGTKPRSIIVKVATIQFYSLTAPIGLLSPKIK